MTPKMINKKAERIVNLKKYFLKFVNFSFGVSILLLLRSRSGE